MLFFSGVRTAEPLWALIDVYGLTRGVQLLGKVPEVARDALLCYHLYEFINYRDIHVSLFPHKKKTYKTYFFPTLPY